MGPGRGSWLDGARDFCAIRPAAEVGRCQPLPLRANPIYLGGAADWIGLWIVFEHASMLSIAAAAAVALGVHLFVMLYEEPTLRRKFGADYEAYCRNVSRLWPRMRGWDKPE